MPQNNFDLNRAEMLLPQLDQWLRSAIKERDCLAAVGQELARQLERIVRLGGCQVNIPHIVQCKRHKDETASRLREAVETVENCGCLLKDLDLGLVDFPCRAGGREFYLCWKLDEPRIQFWHNTDEGFSGRKPIDEKLIRLLQRSCVH